MDLIYPGAVKCAVNNDLSSTAYTAVKHGVVGLMSRTAADLAPWVRVYHVPPTGGTTPTMAYDVMTEYSAEHPRLGELMGNLLPIGAVEPEDIIEAVLNLVFDSGPHITGVTLPVDEGHLLK